MVLLVTSDNEQFNADKDVVERSVLIKNMLEGMSLLCRVVVAIRRDLVIHIYSFLCCRRCRRIRPTYSFAQCLV